jgi:cytidylate kinase
VVKLYDDEEKNAVELAELFAVGRSTVCRTLARAHALAVVEAGKGDRDNCARWGLPGEGMVREAVENMRAPGPFSGLIYRL